MAYASILAAGGGCDFFTTIKPQKSKQAEEMLRVNQYDNFAEEVTEYTIKKGTSYAYGNVAGGSGDQLFIPKDLQNVGSNQVIKGTTQPLPQQ